MARRDRIPLTTAITQATLKGWRIDPQLTIDLSTGKMGGSISFYDTSGRWVASRRVDELGNGGDFQLTAAQVEQIATLFVNRATNRDATLAGTRIVEDVATTDATVTNP